MKSAYELAMERMEAASGPTKRLSDEDKAKIAAMRISQHCVSILMEDWPRPPATKNSGALRMNCPVRFSGSKHVVSKKKTPSGKRPSPDGSAWIS